MVDMTEKKTETIDVSYVANLARLVLTPDETERFQGQLEQILAYVEEMGTLDVDNVEPTAHAFPVNNVFREDDVKPSLERSLAMDNAPLHRTEQFVVPKIIE